MGRNRERLRILLVSSIDDNAINKLTAEHDVIQEVDADPESLAKLVGDRQVIIFRSGVEFTADTLAAASDLKLMIRAGAGLDNVDTDYLARRGIDLKHFPEPGSRAVAELTIGLIIALSRNIVLADRLLRRNQWAKRSLMGVLLKDKILGIVGVGRIGLQVGSLASSLGMECVGCVEPSLMDNEDVARSAEEHGIRLTGFDEVVTTADYLTIHVPLSDDTHHLIDGDVIDRMKPGSFLVNTSRGGVVSEKDLCRALENDSGLRGAALDVYEGEMSTGDLEESLSRLSQLPNVILTPHIGSMASEVQRQIGERIVELVDEAASDW